MKRTIIICFVIISIILTLCISAYIHMIPLLKRYGELEVDKFNQLIITHSYFTSESQYQDLVIIERGDNDTIELIDFDMIKVNQLSTQIVLDIENTYASLEESTYQAKDESYYERRLESVSQNGIITKVPLFSLLGLPVPTFLSPSFRICYKHLASVGSSIEKNVENYGVNHIMVELNIIIHIKLTMIYPFFEQTHLQDVRIPVLLEIFQGQVPLVYTKQ